MHVLFAGDKAIPEPQIRALLQDLVKSSDDFRFKVQPPVHESLAKVLMEISDGINVAYDTEVTPTDTIIVAWDHSPLVHALVKTAREKGIKVLDLENWLDEIHLEEENIYRCD